MPDITYASSRWPWRVTATYRNGDVRTEDYDRGFDPAGFAQKLSENPDIERVELATVFVAGQQVAPEAAHAAERSTR